MTNIIINKRIKVSKPFFEYVDNEIRKFYQNNNEKICKVDLDSIQYKRINDSDNIGLIETMKFKMVDGKVFKADFHHFRYSNFECIQN